MSHKLIPSPGISKNLGYFFESRLPFAKRRNVLSKSCPDDESLRSQEDGTGTFVIALIVRKTDWSAFKVEFRWWEFTKLWLWCHSVWNRVCSSQTTVNKCSKSKMDTHFVAHLSEGHIARVTACVSSVFLCSILPPGEGGNHTKTLWFFFWENFKNLICSKLPKISQSLKGVPFGLNWLK